MSNRVRNIKKQFWLSDSEDEVLKSKCKKTQMTEATYIRSLILGYEPKNSPTGDIYNFINKLNSISNYLNRLVEIANKYNKINKEQYEIVENNINNLILEIKTNFIPMKTKGK